MIHILLVEDDEEIARIIKYYLAQEDFYEVTWAKNAAEALTLSKDNIDLFLLDIMLPDKSGVELCKELRQHHKSPVIFISCVDDNETIIQALENGGDDYITKPFDNKVLHARIMANIRRVQLDNEAPIENQLKCETFTLDVSNRILQKENGETHPLIQIEFKLLSFLMMHPNQAYKASELYRHIWGKSSYGDNRTVVVHIHNLRKKCEVDPANPKFIKSIWGKGYLFDPTGK